MAEQTQNIFYKTGSGQFFALPDAGNTPFGYTPVTKDEYFQGLNSEITRLEESKSLPGFANISGFAARQDQAIQQLRDRIAKEQTQFSSALGTATGGGQSGYVLQNGVPTTQAAIDQQQANAQGLASGALKEIAPGQFVPTGSAAEQLSSGTLTTQNQQQLGLQQIAPGQYVPVNSPAAVLSQTGVLPTSATQPRPLNQAAQSATNLNDFFVAQGGVLPSIQERAGLYQRLTGKTGYQGTVAQNNELLAVLKQQGQMGTGVSQEQGGNTVSTDVLGTSGLNIQGIQQGSSSTAGALTKLQPTPAEQNLDAIGKRMTDIVASSGNQQADLLAQEKALGVEAKQKALDDVLAQARSLEAEVMQQSEVLRNQAIPSPFVIGQQNELQRAAAVKLNALAAYAETLRGNLESAKQSAKDYIDAKYAKQEAELKALELQYNLNKDALDRQDKKASEQLALSLDLRKEALTLQRDADARAFEKEMLALKNQYDQASSGGTSGISNQQIDNERALMSQFRGEPIVKNYNDVLNKKLSVDAIIDRGVSGPADLALVFEFMKSLDPTSVVRESEYAAASKSGNIFAGAYARFNGYLNPNGGFLPPQVKSEFQAITDAKLKVAQSQYDNVSNQYKNLSERQGLNPQNVVIDYTLPSSRETLGVKPLDFSSSSDDELNAAVGATGQSSGGNSFFNWIGNLFK